MENSEIARIFHNVADLLEIKGENPYKIRAYRNVVRSIKELTVPLRELVVQGRLKEVPGAGEAIRQKIVELVSTGRLTYYDKLASQFPEGISSLLEIPGVGPKTAKMLYHESGIRSLAELEKAIKSEQLEPIPGLGPKTKENIRRGLESMKNKNYKRAGFDS
jgi:DNA polymerase (family 10)